jgi:hypothetical protein
MAVPPVLEGLGSHPSRSQPERTRREDRRLKFYELRDNLVIMRHRQIAGEEKILADARQAARALFDRL